MTSSNLKSVDENNSLSLFLKYVVEGNEEQVLATLENADNAHLEQLLLNRGVVTDFSGRKIEGTAFQIALGAEDVEMCEMMIPFFDKIPNGRSHQLAQFKAQYPEEIVNENYTQDVQALEKVIAVIAAAKNIEECEPAITEFRNHFKPTSMIKTGKHFSALILVEALKTYKMNYIKFGDWDSQKNNFCWTNVIGYLERQLPACYAQAFCQGLVHIIVDKELLQRSFHFLHADYDLFPLDSTPNFRLGYDYAGGQWGLWDGKASSDRAIASADSLKTYIEQKRQRLIALGTP